MESKSRSCQIRVSFSQDYTSENQQGLFEEVFKDQTKKDRRAGQKSSYQTHPPKYHESCWRLEQNIAYGEFLKQNMALFYRSRQERRLMKINVLISRHVKTRSSDQCRSHHQKMVKYHGDIHSIVEHIDNLKLKKGPEEKNEIQEENPEDKLISTPAIEMKEANNTFTPSFSLWDAILYQNQEENSIL